MQIFAHHSAAAIGSFCTLTGGEVRRRHLIGVLQTKTTHTRALHNSLSGYNAAAIRVTSTRTSDKEDVAITGIKRTDDRNTLTS